MRYKKGQSGNPGGKRKEKLVRNAIDMVLAEDPKRLRRVITAMFDKAEGGDTTAANMLFDRIDGKPEQSVDLTTRDESLASLTLAELASRIAGLEERGKLATEEAEQPTRIH